MKMINSAEAKDMTTDELLSQLKSVIRDAEFIASKLDRSDDLRVNNFNDIEDRLMDLRREVHALQR
jgi:hypothetical protein